MERFDRMVSWRILAVVAFTAIVAQPALAAEAKPTPHADAAQGGAPSGAAAPAEGKTELDTAAHTAPHSGSTVRGHVKGPGADAAHGGVVSGTAPGSTPSIDLVRPDDGYTNLRHRAVGASLIAGRKQNPEFGRPNIAPHLPSVGPAAEPSRTATGTIAPALPLITRPDGLHPNGIVPTGLPRNNLGLAATEPHRPDMPMVPHVALPMVSGINGTTMGHTNPSTIGGAAKDHSAIAGTSYRHR